jgi:hypothetical protein
VSPRPPLFCDFSQFQPYEIGAMIATWMCWPGVDDDVIRANRFNEMCGWSFHQLVARNPGSEILPWSVKPIYVSVKSSNFDYGSKEFAKRLARMFDFGHQSMVFIKAEATGKEELPSCMKKLTLSALLDARADADAVRGRPITDAANFRRLWRPSLPVIHIAAAWQVQLQIYARAGRVVDAHAFFHDHAVIEDWVRQAHEIEPFALRAFPDIGDEQVRFRLA